MNKNRCSTIDISFSNEYLKITIKVSHKHFIITNGLADNEGDSRLTEDISLRQTREESK
jgi:hypothetical protein